MKLNTHIIIIAAALALYSCGSSKKAIIPPTIVVDSKPSVADNIASGIEAESDTVIVDTIYSDSTLTDTIPFIRATASWKEEIRDGITNILDDPLLETSVCGLEVWDLDDDISLFRHDERQRLRPASTLKTITAITALNELGSDYDFTTAIYYAGPMLQTSDDDDETAAPVSHTWSGDLYIVGGMDPKISSADVTSLARKIKQQGVDSITGTIYADQSFKDNKKWAEGWCWDDDNNPLLLPLEYSEKDRFIEVFIARLRQEGIYVDGSQGVRQRPDSARLVAECRRPIGRIMRPMLKNSNNACAESVFYAMINHAYGRHAKASQGQTMIKQLMRRAGSDDTESYDIVDGSGLSLYDYVDAHVEVLMLRYAWQNRDIYNTFYPLLPVAGRDGTLRKRMKGTRAAGNVHAKTGTVVGVRSLCGYLTARNGHHIAFSIINQGVSGSYGTAKQARNMQDRICELICNAAE